MGERAYIAIDLKSFYASVECVERHLDPLTANLVVADAERTEKTICLAVTPSLKAYGLSGRARLFEVVQKVNEVNRQRLRAAAGARKAVRLKKGECWLNHQPEIAREDGTWAPSPAGIPPLPYRFARGSYMAPELAADPSAELTYIIARPRMALYMEYSTRVYGVYLRYVAPEDIHVYSVDECFLDVTNYLQTYGMTARELCVTLIRAVLKETGITATGGIGTNLYLCKVAMDIVAKHMPADADGVRIAELNEMSYRRELWTHQPLTDFWRVGPGTARKLEARQIYTMGDLARFSLIDEARLYKLFGVNAELLIDHAWGYESCTMEQIKKYRPSVRSLSSGQVLAHPYPWDKARLIVREMAELLALELVEKRVMTDRVTLTVCYDGAIPDGVRYDGPLTSDGYGRPAPAPVNGSAPTDGYTSSGRQITERLVALFERITDPRLTVRRVNMAALNVLPEETALRDEGMTQRQLDFFSDDAAEERKRAEKEAARRKERALQEAVLGLKHRYGKNAVLMAMNLQEGGTTIERNGQVGGHRA